MIAPASVPQVMTAESFHHSVPSPRSGMMSSRRRTWRPPKDRRQPDEEGQRRLEVHLVSVAYRALAIAALIRYDTPLATTIMMRITKIQTSSWTCTSVV